MSIQYDQTDLEFTLIDQIVQSLDSCVLRQFLIHQIDYKLVLGISTGSTATKRLTNRSTGLTIFPNNSRKQYYLDLISLLIYNPVYQLNELC